MNRISIVCLGVQDMARAVHFYRDQLGFETKEEGDNPAVIFFNTSGTKFELYPIDLLAQDINPANPPELKTGSAGITLAYNVPEKADVDRVIECVRAAGGKIVKEASPVFWGGYHAYFQDHDGYYWEVAWGPDFTYDAEGHLLL